MMLRNLALTVGLLAATAATASADPVWGTDVDTGNLTGSRVNTSAKQVIYSAPVDNRFEGMTVDWAISWNTSTNLWDYGYTFTLDNEKTFSHAVLEVSDDALFGDITGLKVNGVDRALIQGDPQDYGSGQGNSNPGLVPDMFGIKVNDNGVDVNGSTTLEITFSSTRSPVWGNFYVQAAKNEFAVNQGFQIYDSVSGTFTATDTDLFIARPNGDGNHVVPEPSSLAVAGVGGIGLMILAARRRKRARVG